VFVSDLEETTKFALSSIPQLAIMEEEILDRVHHVPATARAERREDLSGKVFEVSAGPTTLPMR
jgi:hypothetical protein